MGRKLLETGTFGSYISVQIPVPGFVLPVSVSLIQAWALILVPLYTIDVQSEQLVQSEAVFAHVARLVETSVAKAARPSQEIRKLRPLTDILHSRLLSQTDAFKDCVRYLRLVTSVLVSWQLLARIGTTTDGS